MKLRFVLHVYGGYHCINPAFGTNDGRSVGEFNRSKLHAVTQMGQTLKASGATAVLLHLRPVVLTVDKAKPGGFLLSHQRGNVDHLSLLVLGNSLASSHFRCRDLRVDARLLRLYALSGAR